MGHAVDVRDALANEMRDAFLEGWSAGVYWRALIESHVSDEAIELSKPRNPYDPFDIPEKRVEEGLSEFESEVYRANQHRSSGWHAGFAAAMEAS